MSEFPGHIGVAFPRWGFADSHQGKKILNQKSIEQAERKSDTIISMHELQCSFYLSRF